MTAAVPPDAKQQERADVLALLARRRANCAAVIRSGHDRDDSAAVQLRQIDVLGEMIAQGLHEGHAAMPNVPDAPFLAPPAPKPERPKLVFQADRGGMCWCDQCDRRVELREAKACGSQWCSLRKRA